MGKLRVRGRTNRKADECRKPVGSPVYRSPAVRAEVGANACPAGRWSLVFLRGADHAYPIARIESAGAVRCAGPTLAFDAVTRDHEPGWSGKFSHQCAAAALCLDHLSLAPCSRETVSVD